MPNNKKDIFTSPAVESDSIEALSLKLLKVTDELSKSNEALKESERIRKEMLANISHDLRAPITAIRSAVDLLTSESDISKEDLSSALGLIDRRVSTLESLIDDMYFLFSIDGNAKPFEYEVVDLGPFLESYFYDAIVDARYDNHEMNLDVPMDLDAQVKIDVQKTIRVLDNLFTNAAKYSGAGTAISLSAAREGDHVIITVSDNGIGIDEASLPHIFDRTYTVSKARTPGASTGSGLGLAICKAVIEKEGGKIWCESVRNSGSSFKFILNII